MGPKARKHIALLALNLKGGGAERVAALVASGLAERYSMDLLLFHAEGPHKALLDPRVRTIDLDRPPSFWAQFRAASPLTAYLREENPELVLAFGHKSNRALIAAALQVHYQGGLIVSERNRFTEMYSNPVARALRRQQNRMLYRYADLCICVSKGVEEDLIRQKILSPDRSCCVYNPVVVTGMDDPVPHEWFSGENGPIVLGAGSLNTRKDFETLVRAFALLLDVRSDARLVILGEGRHRARLECLAEELGVSHAVSLPGFFPNLAPFMARTSLFVSSARSEGFSNVLAEALACGLNIVSTDCPSGPSEILEEGRWGWLVPVGDVHAMARSMAEALAHPKPSELLKKRAAYFSFERGIEGYARAIEGVLARKSNEHE